MPWHERMDFVLNALVLDKRVGVANLTHNNQKVTETIVHFKFKV